MNILVVDGYNMIGAWSELQQLKDKELAKARDLLIDWMADYQAYSGSRVIVVFDAYEVRGLQTNLKTYDVEIIFTKERETADECIERLVKSLKNVKNQVYVATSDFAEQRTIFGQGALRKSARELYIELKNIEREIAIEIEEYSAGKFQPKIPLDPKVRKAFEKMRRGMKY
ncbi:NYN domain-containing protein [Aciduricibacillus chroicocephali]|uniref:NYN domain-containing protein n=1 Tax=Aciduricibacillus chroicocephali TaxID=3054939 RepID=A0ABY9KVB5_9BACI|nr:NYN domain-containing protein [Bacillaceae bacterium 44XB]